MGDEPGEYRIEQTSQHFALGLTPLKHEYSYTGEISVPDPDVPGKMRVKFPLSKLSKTNYILFDLWIERGDILTIYSCLSFQTSLAAHPLQCS